MVYKLFYSIRRRNRNDDCGTGRTLRQKITAEDAEKGGLAVTAVRRKRQWLVMGD